MNETDNLPASPPPPKLVTWNGWTCSLHKRTYQNGRLALNLFDVEDGEPVATATTNLVNETAVGPNQAFIKSYAENEGLLEALEAAGVVRRTGRVADLGYCTVELCDILI